MDEITNAKNQFRMEQWAELIRERHSSGMTVDAWCEANGLSKHAYYYWLRKLRKAAMQQTDLAKIPDSGLPTTFKKLEVTTPVVGTQTAVIIHMPSATMEVCNGANRQTVEAVLLALRSVC